MEKLTNGSIRVQLKKIFKLLKYIFLATLCILIIDFMITVEFKEPSKYPYFVFGGDGYTYFGDGRFQIFTIQDGEGNDIRVLSDEEFYLEEQTKGVALIFDVEKYLQQGENIYLVGYYAQYTVIQNDIEYPSLSYADPKIKQIKENNSFAEVPRYTILNYETGDIQLYKTLDEVPESDRKIFEKDLNFWCKFKRTCFEK